MKIAITGLGLLSPAGIGTLAAPPEPSTPVPGPVPNFRPQLYIEHRKNLKLMTQAVRLGVSAVALAIGECADFSEIAPVRRAFFVGSNPLGNSLDELLPAMDISTDAEGVLDLERFAHEGIPRIHPLWLVKGLSNNVLGFSSASHDIQGANANYCQGEQSGLLALHEAIQTLSEGRADLAVAGATDCLVGAEAVFPQRALGEGAAFFVLRPAREGDRLLLGLGTGGEPLGLQHDEAQLGYLGVAGPLVSLARALLTQRGPVTAGTPPTCITAAWSS